MFKQLPRDYPSIFRFVGFIIAALAYFGVNVPNEWHEWATGAIMLIMALIAAWRNNYLSQKGKEQKQALKQKQLD